MQNLPTCFTTGMFPGIYVSQDVGWAGGNGLDCGVQWGGRAQGGAQDHRLELWAAWIRRRFLSDTVTDL